MEKSLKSVKSSSLKMRTLSSAEKNSALDEFAKIVKESSDFLLTENQKDLKDQEGKITQSLYQRLKLDQGKINQLVQGILDLKNIEDPTGKLLSQTKIDNDLILQKTTVAIGVIGVIFESRPDVIPQILSLILKSGNSVILKGGKEAIHSNKAFMSLVEKLNHKISVLPKDWAILLDSREDVKQMLSYSQYVDLVIPRGSNELVSYVMNSTKIPVLGHADGVCHIYLDKNADIKKSIPIIVDSKVQYPAACNAVETLLVHEEMAKSFFPLFSQAINENQITIKACPKTHAFLKDSLRANEEDWSTEYGDQTLSVKVVSNIESAIDHINQYGSHHTDCILSEDKGSQSLFLSSIDSSSVFVNASTRFADGFRYGFGAEVGISTAKTHARGPVGLDGLVIYKYQLFGNGQIVKDYTGDNPKKFLHQKIPTQKKEQEK